MHENTTQNRLILMYNKQHETDIQSVLTNTLSVPIGDNDSIFPTCCKYAPQAVISVAEALVPMLPIPAIDLEEYS